MENNIYVLADAFLSISTMTHKKLQKLCYYAKVWYLALYDDNLVEEGFEAWVHGPVNPELYDHYKRYGFDMIPMVFSADIPEEFRDFARKVYNTYGDLSGDELEELTHSETPWKNARGTLKPWEGGKTLISENDMKMYYRSIMEN